MSNFENICAGDIVKFRVPNGFRRVGYSRGKARTIRDYKVVQAKVNPLLIFEDHVVANYGSCGTVVDKENFISVVI